MPRRLSAALAMGALALAGGHCPGQAPLTLRAAFAAGPRRATVPALAWLCSQHLPKRPEWPRGLSADETFVVSLSPAGPTIRAEQVTLPPDVAAAGSCAFGGGPTLLWSCATDGTEDWFVPLDFEIPAALRSVLRTLGADLLDQPHRLDASVVVGHLAPAMSDGDPRLELLRLGASLCGEVTWLAWRTPSHLRVRGRSEGGLLLPAALLLWAIDGSTAASTPKALCAFASRDGDRAEAARQLSRVRQGEALAPLRALLHADDQVRLAAIDTLVRLRAVEELPRIVEAAGPGAPWASLAAADAVRELWIDAPPEVRQRTRVALAQSRARDLRAIDTTTLPAKRAGPAPVRDVDAGSMRARSLLLLGLLAVGLHGLWRRERCRLAPAAP
ncbi:MAG TPA: HEAT repeat domain-containing protein [Planctomycetota bacterium]|nr:HEAT repeat domain-containing protein [Planctomycetota bacterium]